MPIKELDHRMWASTYWQLIRIGAKAGKYRYTIRVAEIYHSGSRMGKIGAYKIKFKTTSLSEARKEYKIMSYNLRTPSQAGL